MHYREISWNLSNLMFCQSPIWAWEWSSSLLSLYLFWYLVTSNIPLLQLTQFTKKINTKYLHKKEKSNEIDGPLFRRSQNAGVRRTFHQHGQRCKQSVQQGWYLILSLCGNDDQLASGGKHRHRVRVRVRFHFGICFSQMANLMVLALSETSLTSLVQWEKTFINQNPW